LITSISVLISCKSNKVETEYRFLTPRLDFIDFPNPEGNLIPLDENMQVVRDNETSIEYVMSNWNYFCRFIEFKSKYDALKESYNSYLEEVDKLQKELNKS